MTTHITKEALLQALKEHMQEIDSYGDEKMHAAILARAAELTDKNPYHDFLGLASREPVERHPANRWTAEDFDHMRREMHLLSENGHSLADDWADMAEQAADDIRAAELSAQDASPKDGWQDVQAEVAKATEKFPTWPTDPLHAVAVLGEEFGELTKAVLQLTYEPHKTSAAEVRTEAIQTAAMALRFVESLDIYAYSRCEQHEQGPPK